jgi:hypothetical protein
LDSSIGGRSDQVDKAVNTRALPVVLAESQFGLRIGPPIGGRYIQSDNNNSIYVVGPPTGG